MKNIHSYTIIGFLAVLLASCASQPTPKLPVPPTPYPATMVSDYFPLAKGAYWVYQGTVKWQIGTAISEKNMQWKMEVVDVVKRGDTIGFKMLGAPWDLAWFDENTKPSEYVFIKAGSSRFYQGDLKDYARLLDAKDSLLDLVKDGRLFLDIPLTNGEKMCETAGITRVESMYCWNVAGGTSIKLADVKGIDAKSLWIDFTISEATMPDISIFHFVPGIGITRYKYDHHGSVSDVDVQLIEYHPGE